ncbi:MAG: alpha/beta fold hydrolase [Flavobacteriales bacterium]
MDIQNIYYQREGKGLPVVLLHGFLEDMTMWDEYTSQLMTQYTVLRIDLLGHGKTTCQNTVYSMEAQAEVVKGVLRKERISKAVIVGHSMGGYVTLAFAEQYPEMTKGFCLFFSSTLADNLEKKKQRSHVAKLIKTQKESFLRIAIPSLFHENQKKSLQPYIEKTKKMAEKITTEAIIASLNGMRLRKDRTHILRSSIPKQWLVGNFDSTLSLESFQEQKNIATNLDFRTFDIGHMGHYEAPEETLNALQEFIKRCYSNEEC